MRMRWALVQVLMPSRRAGHPDNTLPGVPDGAPDQGLPEEPDYPDQTLPEPGDPVDPDFGVGEEHPVQLPGVIEPPQNLPTVPPGSTLVLIRRHGKWQWAILPPVPVAPTPLPTPTPPPTAQPKSS